MTVLGAKRSSRSGCFWPKTVLEQRYGIYPWLIMPTSVQVAGGKECAISARQ